MDGAGRSILYILTGLAGLSMVYFLSLIVHLPLIIACLLIIAFLFAAYKYVFKEAGAMPALKHQYLHLGILAVGCFLITNRTFYLASKYGDWDAWGIWNFHARYLTYLDSWKTLFANTQYAHPDYPLGLPAIIAFFNRITLQHNSLNIPFIVSFLFTLFIPLLVYLSLYRRNIFIAAASLLLLATDEFFLERGVSQFADTVLAAYLVAALITINHVSADKRMLLLAAFFAGCMAWIKNEGLLLAIVFILFYVHKFFTKEGIWYFIIGISLPLLVVAIFKVFYAPQNDLLHAGAGSTISLIFHSDRYPPIWKHFTEKTRMYFLSTEIAVAAYAVLCVVFRKWPDRQAFLLLTLMAVYMLIYVITPYDQDWHLHSSLNRLMHQLMPAFIYVVALRFSNVQLAGLKQ